MPETARRTRERGFTIIEAAVSMTVLAVALLSLWGTIVYCSRSNVAAEQKKRAMNAAQAMIEDLKSHPFESLLADYGPGGLIGDRFGVDRIDDDQTRAEGRIVFFIDETNAVGEPVIGFPLDLNGDGDMVDTDVAADYELLPVRVSIRRDGALGEQQLDLRTILRQED